MTEVDLDIQNHWQKKANDHGAEQTATHSDTYLRKLEIEAISSHLTENSKIIDVGCGNGFSTMEFAKHYPTSQFLGVDYASQMIKFAQESQNKQDFPNLQFKEMDILNANPSLFQSFDIAITERCIINLPKHELQVQAFQNLCQLVKPGGKILLSEETIQSYNNINNLRLEANLDPMSIQWHNLYIDFPKFIKDTQSIAKLEFEVNFSSSYYLATRYFKALLCKQLGLNPAEDLQSDYHKYSSNLPILGDFGLLKLFVFTKL
ncbi:class I SAM-dependent methyltransferase [bacterium]|nr:class I SAM-dependent methyltransferase [bacterium]